MEHLWAARVLKQAAVALDKGGVPLGLAQPGALARQRAAVVARHAHGDGGRAAAAAAELSPGERWASSMNWEEPWAEGAGVKLPPAGPSE